MSDRFASALPDVRFKPAGSGHVSGWRCDDCGQQHNQAGRKLFRRGGARLWRCAGCVQRRASGG